MAIAELRRVAVDALSSPTGAESVDEQGVHRVNYLPHDVASELIERIDGGATMEQLVE